MTENIAPPADKAEQARPGEREAIQVAAKRLHEVTVYPPGQNHDEHWTEYRALYEERTAAVIAVAYPIIASALANLLRTTARYMPQEDAFAISADLVRAASRSGVSS